MWADPNRDHGAAAAAAALGWVRDRRPKVHCLTSPVALELSANVLLAVGAVPSLTGHAAGVRDFVAATDALVVNLGMLDPGRGDAILAATETAHALGRPWLLDPVKVELGPSRLAFARRLLLASRPAVVRGNAAEIAALGGDPARLARDARSVVARTGAQDLVTDGARHLNIANGSELMDRVTAVGCAASAVAGAFLAVEPDAWTASVAALLAMGVAGEIAAARARGPGSFAVELLDALHRLDEATLLERARLR
jgi:hydroxyethylthiazole kinase